VHVVDRSGGEASGAAMAFRPPVDPAIATTTCITELITGSMGLLGDAPHNLSDVSTRLVVFLGFRISMDDVEIRPKS
jgi:hypothetical protein